MIYEIINMSDAYTIEAKSLEVAAVACLLLGRGQYAFQPLEEGGIEVPIFMFGGHEEWCQKHFQKSLNDLIEDVTTNRAAELIECFESCLIGNKATRQTYYDGLELIDDPDKRKLWRDRWHEERRSSMNDIGGRAYQMAENLRAKNPNPIVDAPRQVFSA